jgi:hypothetical protein
MHASRLCSDLSAGPLDNRGASNRAEAMVDRTGLSTLVLGSLRRGSLRLSACRGIVRGDSVLGERLRIDRELVDHAGERSAYARIAPA